MSTSHASLPSATEKIKFYFPPIRTWFTRQRQNAWPDISTTLEPYLVGTPFKLSRALKIIILKSKIAEGDRVLHVLASQIRNRLVTIDDALRKTECDVQREHIETFARGLVEQASEFESIYNRPLMKRILQSDADVEKAKDILRELDDCFVTFHIAVSLSTERQTAAIYESLQGLHLASWPRSRQAVYNADLDTTLSREPCTPGTRTTILNTILNWAKDSSSAPVYWLHGMAGTGKSTIAYSVCQQIEQSQDNTLAASFFCSRQIDDTRRRKYIVPTIVYQIARRSRSFFELLLKANFDAVDVARMQMKELLVDPWEKSASQRPSGFPPCLVVIDGLDENDGGSEFLEELLHVVEQGQLQGLRFLVTSRRDPEIVAVIQDKAVCYSQEVDNADVQADILTYLNTKLPALCDKPQLQQLAQRSGNLFAYAATAVRFLSPRYPHTSGDQEDQLVSFLKSWPTSSDSGEAMMIDRLYEQILLSVFAPLGGAIRRGRLGILHTIICAAEPVSASVVTDLLPDFAVDEHKVRLLVNDLHGVIYVSKDDQRFHCYHPSFFDFVCDSERPFFTRCDNTIDISCHASSHHALLAQACFRVMGASLPLDICRIPASPVVDSNASDSITSSLRYSSRHWAHHLVQADPAHLDDLCIDLEEFCNARFMSWIELMRSIGEEDECYNLLELTKEWLGKDGTHRSIWAVVGDAANRSALSYIAAVELLYDNENSGKTT